MDSFYDFTNVRKLLLVKFKITVNHRFVLWRLDIGDIRFPGFDFKRSTREEHLSCRCPLRCAEIVIKNRCFHKHISQKNKPALPDQRWSLLGTNACGLGRGGAVGVVSKPIGKNWITLGGWVFGKYRRQRRGTILFCGWL